MRSLIALAVVSTFAIQAAWGKVEQCKEPECPQPVQKSGAAPSKKAKQHSLLQLKTTLSKVVLPPEDDDDDMMP
eukprot:Skav233819  [mRNA]  locus=scaffold5904:61361:64236:+ [translate_table: standard]